MPDPAGEFFGAPVPLLDCNGIIDPSVFPIPVADHVYIGTLASDLRKAGEDMAQTGDDVVSAWGGLADCYTAPESDVLFSALDPVSSDGEEVETGTDRAASALHEFAEEVREIKLAWRDLAGLAQGFRDRVVDDPEWDKADNFITGRSDNVEENNDLKTSAEGIIVRYERAQRDCANAINQGIYGRTRFHSQFDEEAGTVGPNGFVFDTVNSISDLPSEWGEDATADKFWYQDAWDAGMDFGLGAIEGVGGMVGAHSAEGWFAQSWGDSLKEYHWDNITAAASLVGAYDAESNSLTRPGSEPAGEAWKELAHSIVPWTEFADRPGYVFATAALNIGGTVAGVVLTATGVGSVVGVPLLLWRGASILDGMGTPGRGGLGTDVDVSQLPELPRTTGQNAPVVRLDAEDMEAMGLSPSQIAEIEADLRRVMEEQGAGAGGSGSSQDPRVSDTLAFDDIVNHPENAFFGNQVRGENRQGIDEADRAAKTDPTRTPSSEEGTWTAGEVLDGPEGDGARVPAGAGGRGGDSLSESANPAPPPTRADLSGDGPADLNGGRPGNEPDAGNGNRGPDLADRAPTATNQDGGGPGPGTHNGSSNPADGGRSGTTYSNGSESINGGTTGNGSQGNLSPRGSQGDSQGSGNNGNGDPELDKKLEKAGILEKTLRDRGFSDQEISNLRGVNPRDGGGWQRLADAVRQNYGKNIVEEMFPKTIKFAMDGTEDLRQIAYRFEYYKATFDELVRDLESQGLGKNEAKRAAKGKIDDIPVEARMASDREVVSDKRPNQDVRIDPSAADDRLYASLREVAGEIGMGDDMSAAYHARKHYNEIQISEMTGNHASDYLDSLEVTIREGEVSARGPARGGGERLIVRRPLLDPLGDPLVKSNKKGEVFEAYIRAVVIIKEDGSVVVPTYGRMDVKAGE